MSITDMFKILGAPLVSHMWSWGGVCEDGTIVLRVWKDRQIKIDGERYFMVAHHTKHVEEPGPRLGYQERLRHLDMIRQGAKCILVTIRAKDKTASPREIAGFEKNFIIETDGLLEHEGNTYIKALRRVPRGDFTRKVAP